VVAKLHIAVDAKSEKIVSFRVTKGNVHDSKKFSPMIREVSKGCRRCLLRYVSRLERLAYAVCNRSGSDTMVWIRFIPRWIVSHISVR
jgi:hypothetical protein